MLRNVDANLENILKIRWPQEEEMAESRSQTRSSRRRGQQTDAQFWSNQLDPVLIERGQADAI